MSLCGCGDAGGGGTSGASAGAAASPTGDAWTEPTGAGPSGPGVETHGETSALTTSAATGVETTGAETGAGTEPSAGVTGDTGDTSGAETGTTGAMSCPQGSVVCEGGDAKTCDGEGGFDGVEPCPEACVNGLGCVLCSPGSRRCVDDGSQRCAEDGGAWLDDEFCDPLQGVSCDEGLGACVGACSRQALGLSYIGCDYYPTVTAALRQFDPWPFDFAVVVSNTADASAEVIITRGDEVVDAATVGAGEVSVIPLPWVDALASPTINLEDPSVHVVDGAYRLRADQPVTVYQYNPLQYQVGDTYSFINDAGLLLPVNTWRGEHRVISRNAWDFMGFTIPGFYAVVASEDETTVSLTPSATGGAVYPGAGVAANGVGELVLDAGDVLQVFSASAGGQPDASDLTGTRVLADKPVQVIGGHKCTNVPWDVQFCDRLEESIPPVEALGFAYLVASPLIPTGGMTPKAQIVRVVAVEDDTALTYDPPQGGAPTHLASAGDYVELEPTAADFLVTGDKKIAVAQYMLGQNAGGDAGDPAMTIAVPSAQFRDEYLVHAPTNYEHSYANVIAPSGATVTIDGVSVDAFTAIGDTGFGVARVPLSNAGDGTHALTGDSPFGVSVYGYGQYTSYWYPGGLDLETVLQ